MRRLSEIRHKVASLAVKGFFSKSNDMDRGYEEKEKILDSTIFSQYPEQTKTDHPLPPPPPPPPPPKTKQTKNKQTWIIYLYLVLNRDLSSNKIEELPETVFTNLRYLKEL